MLCKRCAPSDRRTGGHLNITQVPSSRQLGSYLVFNSCGEPALQWTRAGVCTSFALRQDRSKCSPPGRIGTEKRRSVYRPITDSVVIAIQGQEAECSTICLSLLSTYRGSESS